MTSTNLPRVPEGLRDLMKTYTKEVLREKPTNLYEFSSDYFERIAGRRVQHKVLKYEPPQSYEIIMKNRIRQQVPISLVFSIIPDNLTELIKKFIKAVLREKPENLLLFAVEYFQRLRNTHSPRLEYTKYAAYEKYVNEKESSTETQGKCSCGRILSAKISKLEAKETLETTHSIQYISSVCIIQKHIRKYLKQKQEKETKVSYKSVDYMNAVFLIQRQFRRYLAKKRAKSIIELKKKNQYDSVEYMNAIRIIQRYCRQYLRKRNAKRPLNNNKNPSIERTFSLTTAAFIIQRAFRNMVKSRRAKRHINAELDQCDEVNDNASEAASYTSASTALLSTESVCEHPEFGGNIYEEGVHQQTIREDEEVENDNTNNLQSEYIKSKGKSINSTDLEMDNRKKRGLYAQRSHRNLQSEKSAESNGNSADLESKVKNKGFNSMENSRNSSGNSFLTAEAEQEKSGLVEETIRKSVAQLASLKSPPNSHEQSLEKPDKSINAEDSITTLDFQMEAEKESGTIMTIKKSISQGDDLETAAQSAELDKLPTQENTILANQSKNSEESLKKSISQSVSLEKAAKSKDLDKVPTKESQKKNKESEESIEKGISQNMEIALQSDGTDKPEQSSIVSKQSKNSADSIEKSISQKSDETDKPEESSIVSKQSKNSADSINKSISQDLETALQSEKYNKTEENPIVTNQAKHLEETIEKGISQGDDIETAVQSDALEQLQTEKQSRKNSKESLKKGISEGEDIETAGNLDELDISTTEENPKMANQSHNSKETIKKSVSQGEDLATAAQSDILDSIATENKPNIPNSSLNSQESMKKSLSQSKDLAKAAQSDEFESLTTEENPNKADEDNNLKESIKKSLSQSEDLAKAAQSDEFESLASKANLSKANEVQNLEESIKKSTSLTEDLETALEPELIANSTQSQNNYKENLSVADNIKAAQEQEIIAQIIPAEQQHNSLDTTNSNNTKSPNQNEVEQNIEEVEKKQQSTPAVSLEDTAAELPTTEEIPIKSMDNNAVTPNKLGSKLENADETDKPSSEKDYSTEVNSLQTVLNTMKEKYNQDEAMLDSKPTSTKEESLDVQIDSSQFDKTADTKDSDKTKDADLKQKSIEESEEIKAAETTEDIKSDIKQLTSPKIKSVDSTAESEEEEKTTTPETYSFMKTKREEPTNTDIGTSIIIHNVVPGEDDYELTLSTEVADNNSHLSETDITAKTAENLDTDKTEDSLEMKENQKDSAEAPIIKEIVKENTQILDSSPLVSSTKETEITKEQSNEGSDEVKDIVQETQAEEFGNTDAITTDKIIDEQTVDSLDKLKEQLESNICKSNDESSVEDTKLLEEKKLTEENNKADIMDETIVASKSRPTSGNAKTLESADIKDNAIGNTNSAMLKNSSSITELINDDKDKIEKIKASAAESSEMLPSYENIIDNKTQSVDKDLTTLTENKAMEKLSQSYSQPEIQIENNKDEMQTERNENMDKNIKETGAEIIEDEKVSPNITQQLQIKNNDDEIDVNKTAAVDAENTALKSSNEEQIQTKSPTKLSSEKEEITVNDITTEIKEEVVEAVKATLFSESPANSADINEAELTEEDQQKQDDKYTPDIVKTIAEETEKSPKIATNDEQIQDNIKRIEPTESEEKLNDSKTTLPEKSMSEESAEKIADEQTNLTQEAVDKSLASSNDDKVNDDIKTSLTKEVPQETKVATKSSLAEKSEEKEKDGKETLSSQESEETSINKDTTTDENLIAKENSNSKSLESKPIIKDDTIPQISIDEPETAREVGTELEKDAVDSTDENQTKSIQKEQSTDEVKAQNTNKNEPKQDSQIAESKSSLLLSNQLTDTQIKKMPNEKKEKQVTSFTSGRLTNVPVAELQLKSFKTDADNGNWYDVYNASEDKETDTIKSAKETKLDNANLQRSESNDVLERRPNYVYGEESAPQETQKPKQSIAFFISFDGEHGKASYKIPKRFLRDAETIKKNKDSKTEQVLIMEPVLAAEEDLVESDIEMGYQQFGLQKLQTIHELNENESSSELKSLLGKSNENVNELEQQEINEVEKVVASTEEIVKKSLTVNETNNENDNETNNENHNETKNEKANESEQTHEQKRKRSAQIIQKAFKKYKIRQEEKQKSIENKKLSNENLAATRIQKAVREFLARAAKKTKEKDTKYSNIEILAAIRIQNMFRNYIRRKQMANMENISKATSATSLVTIIPNTNGSGTPDVSLNETELSDDVTSLNSEVNSTKSEWFVGTQRINVEKSAETGTIGLTELTDSTDTKLATDIGNITNELKASKDNGASNNSAGSTNETLEDLVIAAFGELDATFRGTTTTRQLLSEFLIKEIEFSAIQEPYPSSMLQEVEEQLCIKKSVSNSDLAEEETKEKEDAMDEATSKLIKTEEVIEKMSQRRSSETREKIKEDLQLSEAIFEEPIIRSLSLLQEQSSLDIEDGDIIVYNRLQGNETRESSAQSESVIFGNDDNDDDEKLLSNDAETARTQLSRHYTIAGEDPRVIFRSVTIDDRVSYIENENDNDNEDEDENIGMSNMSFCLDDETSENIRKKMMAYSLSEGDSDYYDPTKTIQDDFHIDTAMNDAMDTSTETESTIVSAATKIQAGARGFLARRRIRRASATKSSTQDTKASFGNDAISESLERFIEEEAAKKIQSAYRFHSKKQKKQANNLKSASLESSLAAKRQTLQRGDALRNDSNSTPEEESSSSTSVGQLPKDVEAKSGKEDETSSSGTSVEQLSKDMETKSSKDNEDETSSSASVGQLTKDMETKSSKDNDDENSSNTSVGQLSKDQKSKSSKDNAEDEKSNSTSVGQLSKDMETKSSNDKNEESNNTTSVGQLSKDAKTKSSEELAEEEISISTSVGQLSKDVESKSSKDAAQASSSRTSVGQLSKDMESRSSKASVATRSKRSTDLGLKWPAVRQNSMPVQIDCEVLRLIPKHMRKRIKSAENAKKKNRK